MAYELFQWDGVKWRDYGPDTPEHEPVYSIDTRGKWVQVSDLRHGHPSALAMLTAAHKYPIPSTYSGHVLDFAPRFLANRRMWTGARWMPGESVVSGVLATGVSGATGSSLEFTQTLDAPGPALNPLTSHPNTAPITRLFIHAGSRGPWVEYKFAAAADKTHHLLSANSFDRSRVLVSPGVYRWTVTFSDWVARVMSANHCALIIDGEEEYGPMLVSFMGAVPGHVSSGHVVTPVSGTPPKVTGVRVIHNTYSAGKVNLTMRWNSVSCSSGSVTYRIYLNGSFSTTRSSAEMITALGHPGSTYNYQVAAVCGGKEGPKSSSVAVVAAKAPAAHHTPTSHTLSVTPIKWTAAYDGNHHRRGDHASNPWQDHLVMGRFDSTHGNTHSVVRFDTSKIPHGAHITSVRLKAYAEHWFLNSGGTAKVRQIKTTRSSPPPTHTAETSGATDFMTWNTKTGWKTTTLTTQQGWATGAINSIQFGPPNSTAQSSYGVLGAKGANKPVLTITYTT